MKTIKKLGAQAVQAALQDLPHWRVTRGRLHREYDFGDFVSAFSFMSHIALLAERRNHHPAWQNSYKRVVVDLSTDEVSGITSRDVLLARDMERVARASLAIGSHAR